MSSYIEKFIDPNKYSRPQLKLSGVKKLVVHYTANPGATAQNHFDYFNKTIVEEKRFASAHIFVDRRQALNIIPLNEVAYHANDVQKKNANGTPYRGVAALGSNANLTSLGIELCIEKDGSFHPDTLALAGYVFAELCRKFGLNECDIVRHYDVTAKNCPAPFVANPADFDGFKNRVHAILNPAVEAKPLMVVKAIGAADIRDLPDHASGFIRNTTDGEILNVWEIKNDWHRVAAYPEKNVFGWIDGNNGKNLYWLDNPALTKK